MSNRGSASSEGVVEEGVVGIKADTKTINQLSSSARAAQDKRAEKAIESLKDAIGKHFTTEKAQADPEKK